ncbi:MAG: diadenylate cyclase, partial [Chloroflexota bacterium]
LFFAIPVIFQPELQRALEQLGGASGRYLRLFNRKQPNLALEAIITASKRLSDRRHGALIVFEQETGLQEYIDTGVTINGEITSDLLLTIFNKNTELHDGAVIVRNGKLAAAACVLPLSAANVSDRSVGLRHRAALGMSEVSDAVSLIISEETGRFAITHNGKLIRENRNDPQGREMQEQLKQLLEALLKN